MELKAGDKIRAYGRESIPGYPDLYTDCIISEWDQDSEEDALWRGRGFMKGTSIGGTEIPEGWPVYFVPPGKLFPREWDGRIVKLED